MICQRCLHRASALRTPAPFIRNITATNARFTSSSSTATSTSADPSFSTPLPPHPESSSLNTTLHLKHKSAPLLVSTVPAGASLKGLNYLKGREDPLALPEEDYPDWLWRCLDSTKKSGDAGADVAGDEFSKSRKQRRVAAKTQRKLEARLLASGDTEALAPKVPLQQQTIDLPANEEGSVKGALEGVVMREEVRKAMRGERRSKIKERNFLKGMR